MEVRAWWQTLAKSSSLAWASPPLRRSASGALWTSSLLLRRNHQGLQNLSLRQSLLSLQEATVSQRQEELFWCAIVAGLACQGFVHCRAAS